MSTILKKPEQEMKIEKGCISCWIENYKSEGIKDIKLPVFMHEQFSFLSIPATLLIHVLHCVQMLYCILSQQTELTTFTLV